MPTFEYHCNECEQKLGNRFEHVNKWLDELMYDKTVTERYRTRHRKFRHHKAGIEQVRERWGDEAAKAAEIHIRADLTDDGWPELNPLPVNEEHFKRSGLW